MREQPVERLWRELRVDRIWEGTSEIQRMVIGNELRKRGADLYTGWPSGVLISFRIGSLPDLRTLPQALSRHPRTSAGKPGISSPAPPFTKS